MQTFRRQAAPLALAMMLLPVAAGRGDAQNAKTREVKAAFLHNFARFTEWPADAFATGSTDLVIGVADDEALRRALDYIIRHKAVGARLLKTRKVKDDDDTADVQILYIGGEATRRAQDFVSAVNQRPVLTVSDVDRFWEKGGMINFLIADNRVRFEIRVDAAERSRLKVSSRVLALAQTLYGTSKP